MARDPIVEEVRKYRDEYAKRFNYDLDAIFHHLREQQQKSKQSIVSFPPKPIRRPVTT